MVTSPMPKPPLLRVVRAAGAVTWRIREDSAVSDSVRMSGVPENADDIEVLIVHRPRYNDWSWPKGKSERGESLVACATREVEEETGYAVRLGARMTTQRYRLGAGHTKEVHYWVGTLDLAACAMRARCIAERAPSSEIDKCRWVGVSKARKLLTRRGDRRLLDELITRLEGGTLCTKPLVILRHAKAISRSDWKGDEARRPLSRIGVSQVPGLTSLLSGFGVEHIITSPWRRCFATVAPYAALTNCALNMDERLTETEVTAHPEIAEILINELLAGQQQSLVLCVHRPCLPHLLAPIIRASQPHIARLIPNENPYLHTVEMLVAHISCCRGQAHIVDVEIHRAS